MKCTNVKCKNDFQDKRYGKKMRVFNKMAEQKSGKNQYRCTVCESIKQN